MSTADADRRRADATQNREAILAAGFDVLSRRPDAGLAEAARRSGLTRTTVYAHFRTREDLLAELRQAVQRAVRAIDAGDPAQGPAEVALQRVLAASWQQVAHHALLTEAIGRIWASGRQNCTPRREAPVRAGEPGPRGRRLPPRRAGAVAAHRLLRTGARRWP